MVKSLKTVYSSDFSVIATVDLTFKKLQSFFSLMKCDRNDSNAVHGLIRLDWRSCEAFRLQDQSQKIHQTLK